MRYAVPMRKSLLLAFILAGCSAYQNPSEMEGNIVTPGNFIAGSGVVVGVAVVRKANKDNPDDPNHYRISLQMDKGGFQQIDTDNGTFFTGQAVNLTNDGRIEHVSGTTMNRR